MTLVEEVKNWVKHILARFGVSITYVRPEKEELDGVKFTNGGETMPKKNFVLKAQVGEITTNTVFLEFGRTQAEMEFSSTGSVQRALKLKEGQKLKVTLELE